jgi:hypothetical protein
VSVSLWVVLDFVVEVMMLYDVVVSGFKVGIVCDGGGDFRC